MKQYKKHIQTQETSRRHEGTEAAIDIRQRNPDKTTDAGIRVTSENKQQNKTQTHTHTHTHPLTHAPSTDVGTTMRININKNKYC